MTNKTVILFSLLSCMVLSTQSFANGSIQLNTVAQGLHADGGQDLTFIPIKTKNQQPLTIESSGNILCKQGKISFATSGLAQIGTLTDIDGQPIAVFDDGQGIGFTLHFGKEGETLIPINKNTVYQCQNDTTNYKVKATFYRKNQHLTAFMNPVIINRTIDLLIENPEKKEVGKILLNAKLNFAKKPENYTCTIVNGANQTLQLGSISIRELNKPTPRGNVKFQLQCDGKTNVIAMVYDKLDANNFGIDKTILSIKKGNGFAQGVGVQLLRNGSHSPIPLGNRDMGLNSPNIIHDATQWTLTENSNDGKSHTLTLQGQLIKTEDHVSTGKVEAKAGIIFFYQ